MPLPKPVIISLSAVGVSIGVLLVAAALFLTVFIILTAPHKRRPEMDKFDRRRYAHRGLHGDGIAENSITAFRAAVSEGYGIELDVRLTKDGELVVFHDDELERVTGSSGKVIDKTLAELRELRLSSTSDTVPTFREVLDEIDGRVPLLVELKEAQGEYTVTEKTAEMLKDYKGDFMVESFNPLALSRLRKINPKIIRGFLSQDFGKTEEYHDFKYFLLEHLLLNFLCRPDFIAYCHADFNMPALRAARILYKAPCFAWTTESEETDKYALSNGFTGTIFQYYRPSPKIDD